MQLTNIARDVGEDARAGRQYLPLHWMPAEGLDPLALLLGPVNDPRLRDLTQRLLVQADQFHARPELGIPALPLACRPGIYAARHVYAGIGRAVARLGYDSVNARARPGG